MAIVGKSVMGFIKKFIKKGMQFLLVVLTITIILSIFTISVSSVDSYSLSLSPDESMTTSFTNDKTQPIYFVLIDRSDSIHTSFNHLSLSSNGKELYSTSNKDANVEFFYKILPEGDYQITVSNNGLQKSRFDLLIINTNTPYLIATIIFAVLFGVILNLVFIVFQIWLVLWVINYFDDRETQSNEVKELQKQIYPNQSQGNSDKAILARKNPSSYLIDMTDNVKLLFYSSIVFGIVAIFVPFIISLPPLLLVIGVVNLIINHRMRIRILQSLEISETVTITSLLDTDLLFSRKRLESVINFIIIELGYPISYDRVTGILSRNQSINEFLPHNTPIEESIPQNGTTEGSILCPFCESETEAGKKYCQNCGSTLPNS